jgi:hypothetical protein
MGLALDEMSLYRKVWRTLCFHCDGVAIGSTVGALSRAGVLQKLQALADPVRIDGLAETFGARRGYFHLAMRLLASQGLVGWEVGPEPQRRVALTSLGHRWVQRASVYEQVPSLLERGAALLSALIRRTAYGGDVPMPDPLSPSAGAIGDWIGGHLWGVPVTAAMAGLSLAGRLKAATGRDPEPLELEADAAIDAAATVLAAQGWLHRAGGRGEWTPEGVIAAAWAAQYYQQASYVETYRRVPALMFGSGSAAFGPERGDEIDSHVNRDVDIRYSGMVFNRTCRDAFFDIVLPIFDRTPLSAQPRYVVDMGCGDGSLLRELFYAIRERTARGQVLDGDPLIVVGVEYSPIARDTAARCLQAAGVPHIVVTGDISEPDEVARTLRQKGVDMIDALQVSKSVIHDRFFRCGTSGVMGDAPPPQSTAVFVAEDGALIGAREMAADLVTHFNRWRPWITRHGMAVIEAHTVDPCLSAAKVGQSLMTGLDASHGYSHQYLVEREFFSWAAEQAGFHAVASRDLATEMVGKPIISIDHFVAAG